MFLQAASLPQNLQNNWGLCTFRGLTADEELQEICSACKKMYFSSTKPYSGPFYSYSFFLIFVSGLFNILFFYCIILSLISSLIKSVLCFMKTWCNLLLLHFLINRIPFYYIISDPPQYSFDRRIWIYHTKGDLKYRRMSFPSCDMKIRPQVGNIKR